MSATLIQMLPGIVEGISGVVPLIVTNKENPSKLEQLMPTILQTVGTGAALLAQWQALAAGGVPTDEQLAELAQATEVALADSQAALRGP